MFKLSPKELHNRPIHHLLQNGFRFALISSTGAILKTERYAYKLDLPKKQFRGSKVVEIKNLLVD